MPRECVNLDNDDVFDVQVSGECEVLQINKKFFMRHCDDAIYSLIRLKVSQNISVYGRLDSSDLFSAFIWYLMLCSYLPKPSCLTLPAVGYFGRRN